jgi:hypothetical protein
MVVTVSNNIINATAPSGSESKVASEIGVSSVGGSSTRLTITEPPETGAGNPTQLSRLPEPVMAHWEQFASQKPFCFAKQEETWWLSSETSSQLLFLLL